MNYLVSLCFFLSGVSGLCFEIVWSRQLSQVFGASTLALSSVLTSYMGGLALGSYLAGKLGKKITRPVLVYALCELSIACFALLIPFFIAKYPLVYRLIWGSFYQNSFYLFSLLRFFLVFLTLLLPTTLMGATLPILTKFFAQQIDAKGKGESLAVSKSVSRLYAINLAGACVGTFLTGFLLLPSLGIFSTTLFAIGINISLALLLLLAKEIVRYQKNKTLPDQEDIFLQNLLRSEKAKLVTLEPGASIHSFGKKTRTLIIVAFAVSGAAAMIYQVLWTRAIAIVIGSSVYAFTLILGCFLIGLFLGSAVGAWALRLIRRPLFLLGAAHMGVALSAYATALYIDRLPQILLEFLAYRDFQEVWQVLGLKFFISSIVVLIPTCFLGTIFPLTMRILGQSKQNASQEVGGAYAANTIGAIFGSFAGGFLLLPWFGLETSLYGTILLSGLLGAGLWAILPKGKNSQRTRAVRVLASVSLFVALIFLAPKWSLKKLNEGFFRLSLAREVYQNDTDIDTPEILYYRDGTSTTVSLEDFGNGILALKVNGKVDASSSTDMITQILAGALPMLLHPEVNKRPLDVAVVGFGSGVTIGSALRFPVKRLDAVEIEKEVVNAARFFSHLNHRVHEDPRLFVHYDDGRNFLQASDTKYDVIVNEPSNPWIAGVASLFTEEYFQQIQKKLAPNGIFLQWLQLYEISPETVRLIIRTFTKVFPNGVLFCADERSPDLFLVASNQEISFEIDLLQKNFSPPAIASEFRRAGVETPFDILSRLLIGSKELIRFAGKGITNTDDNGILEFAAPKDLMLWAEHKDALQDFYHNLFEVFKKNPRLEKVLPTSQSWTPMQQALFAERLAILGRFRAALRYADRADGFWKTPSSLLLPLGPTRKNPFEGGVWHLHAARARVYTALFSLPDIESPTLPDSIVKNPPPPPENTYGVRPPDDDIKTALQAVMAQAKRREARVSNESKEKALDKAIAWQTSYELFKSFPQFFIQNTEWRVLRGTLLYKVGLWRNAIEQFEDLLAQEKNLFERFPEIAYYWAKAEHARGHTARAAFMLSYYLSESKRPLVKRLRLELEPLPKVLSTHKPTED